MEKVISNEDITGKRTKIFSKHQLNKQYGSKRCRELIKMDYLVCNKWMCS